MADVPPQGSAAPSVQALLDALDARARNQAEDAAGRLLTQALDRVGEVLASIEQRLASVEQRADSAPVFTQVIELASRLERFEQAFYRAVSDGGDGSDVVRKIEAVVRQGTADYVRALEGLRDRQPAPDPVDLTPVIVRLDEVSAKIQRPTTDAMRELAERLEAQLDRLHDSFPRLNELRQSWAEEFRPVVERFQSLEEVVARAADVPADLPAAAGRIEAAAERLASLESQLQQRDAALAQIDGRMEGLESRVRAHLAGLTERVEGVMGAVTSSAAKSDPTQGLNAVAESVALLERTLVDIRERAERLEQATGSDRATLEQLQRDLGALPSPASADEVAERVVAALPEPQEIPLPPPPPDVPSVEAVASKVRDVLHSEFELLTQRVAALSVSIDATRTLLDQHVEDTAQSLGRRATEVGRKLAADLGFRPRKDDRRDPRELNRGGH